MEDALSCDTSVVLGSATIDGSVIFAKNSDRNPNECQPLSHYARQQHEPGDTVQCQYLSIPQIEQTWEMIGSRPYWLWGFETGVNEWGVAIGNEAVLTREPYDDPGLIGMDLVRLGLERSTTADEALTVITELIERYGQGGSCEASFFRTYHNSFIIADSTTAWILETAGHYWAAERVANRAAISNLLTIQGQGDRSSRGLESHARSQGWISSEEAFNFASTYLDPNADLSTRVCRLDRAREILGAHRNLISVHEMMALLRDHADRDVPLGPEPLPTICVHANPAFTGETASAMVAHLRPNRPRELTTTIWTAFGSPCLSIFRPVYPFAVGLPTSLNQGGCQFSDDSPWWLFERLQRLVAQAPSLANDVRAEFTKLEATFFEDTHKAETLAESQLALGDRNAALRTLRDLVESTTDRSLTLVSRLTEEIADRGRENAIPELATYWATIGEQVGLNQLTAKEELSPVN
jgi:dipeptidase